MVRFVGRRAFKFTPCTGVAFKLTLARKLVCSNGGECGLNYNVTTLATCQRVAFKLATYDYIFLTVRLDFSER